MINSGLIGRSILASRSPWLHEQEARAQGLDLRYELFDFTDRGLGDDALAPLLADLRSRQFAGVNVTYPFKQAIISLLDELAESAATVGAVNTVAMRDGRLIGHNTDMSGFRASFVEGLPDADLDHVLQFGAGGAGAAVASALLSLGVRLIEIHDVDHARSTLLVDRLQRRFGTDRAKVRSKDVTDIDGMSGIINTTPVGMDASPGSPIDPALLHPSMWVADIIYFPLQTALLRDAQARGCRTLNGGGMVVEQAAAAFEIITGYEADRQRMRRSFNEAP